MWAPAVLLPLLCQLALASDEIATVSVVPHDAGTCGCRFDDIAYLNEACLRKVGSAARTTKTFENRVPFVDFLLRSTCRVTDTCRRADHYLNKKKIKSQYDFIVVGGGVAGSVVAARLSENPSWSVLLLEAGPEEPTTTSVPAFSMEAIGTELDWGFKTQPQDTACLETGGSCYWPRGKMLGGTSGMTGMMYMRGHKGMYDDLVKQGNYGWSYKECLEFFKKSENNKNPDIIEEDYHGKDGPLTVQWFPYQPQMVHDLVKAGQELGYRYGDLNGANQTGFTVAQAMVDGGLRASTARMYLRPSHSRKNLLVQINSRVIKVIMDKNKNRAKSVVYVDRSGKQHSVKANKEIIISAGAVNSPHILLLSGIGPKKDLKKHGIKVIKDLQVGQNLHNHVSIGISFTIEDVENEKIPWHDIVMQYMKDGTGPMSCTGITQTTAFLVSKYAQDDMPDLQFFFDGFETGCRLFANKEERESKIQIRPVNLRPLSKGYLTLNSSDPFDPPLIYPNYFAVKRDMEVMIDGIRKAISMTDTSVMKKWNMQLDKEPQPLCAHKEFNSDDYWECYVRSYTGPENHQAGTCKMGPSPAGGAVVDPELRVHGIPNLRVIDASIFPDTPNCNTIAPVIMVAEKGAHMIAQQWNER